MYYDEYVERAMLYYLIFDDVDYLLDENDFVMERNKAIMKAINQLKSQKKEVSMISVRDIIKGDKTQILKHISSLVECTYGTNPDEVYNKLMKLSKKRKLLKLLQENLKELDNIDDVDILAEKTIQDINKIHEINEKEKTFVEQVAETAQEIEKKTTEQEDYSLYTGMTDLDNMLCGLHNQELTIIGARPRNWKNNFCTTNSRKNSK